MLGIGVPKPTQIVILRRSIGRLKSITPSHLPIDSMRRAPSLAVMNAHRLLTAVQSGEHCADRREGRRVEVAIRKTGNSLGILIPKPILAEPGLEGRADLHACTMV